MADGQTVGELGEFGLIAAITERLARPDHDVGSAMTGVDQKSREVVPGHREVRVGHEDPASTGRHHPLPQGRPLASIDTVAHDHQVGLLQVG